MKTFIKATNLIFAFIFTIMAFESYSQTAPDEKSIKFENEQTAVLVGHDGLIMRTEDAGLTWTTQVSGVTNVLHGTNSIMDYNQDGQLRIQIAVGENGTILKSIDNGLLWIIKDAGITQTLRSIHMIDNSLYIAAGDTGIIVRTVDKGESWETVSTGVSENLNDVMFVLYPAQVISAVKGIAVGNNGTILTSNDYGVTWSQVTSNTSVNLNSLYYAYEQLLFAVGDNGVILKSEDSGDSWAEVTSGVTEHLYGIKFIDESIAIATGANGLIIRSVDGGNTWSEITSGVSSDLFAVSFCNSSFGITVGESGTELYTNDGGLTWENREQERLASKTSTENTDNIKLNQNYPNPFNPSTVINYEIPANANVSVKIYDLVGKEVRTLVNGYQTAGTHSAVFNAANLSSGIYFYVLRVNTGVNEINKTMRMILTK